MNYKMKNKTPQLEKGFIQIASGKEENDILMALIKQRLNATQYQIMLLVIRKTWGFKKKEDWISLTQFEKYLSKSRASVCKEIKQLVKNNLLVKKSILGVRASYHINKDFTKWKPLVKKTRLVNKIRLTSKQNKTQLVKKSIHTKDTITKETYTKDNTPQAELVFFFTDTFNRRFNKPYKPFKPDYINMADLLKTYPLKNLKTYIKWYINWDTWQTKSGWNIGHFYRNINSVISSASPFTI